MTDTSTLSYSLSTGGGSHSDKNSFQINVGNPMPKPMITFREVKGELEIEVHGEMSEAAEVFIQFLKKAWH